MMVRSRGSGLGLRLSSTQESPVIFGPDLRDRKKAQGGVRYPVVAAAPAVPRSLLEPLRAEWLDSGLEELCR